VGVPIGPLLPRAARDYSGLTRGPCLSRSRGLGTRRLLSCLGQHLRASDCEGFKIAEVLGQGFSDSIDRNGRAWGYDTITLDNGDKIYTEWSGTRIAVTGADGSLKTTFSGTTTWIGGTGRYLGVRGFSRDKAETLYVKDSQGKLKATTNNGLKEVEYWFEK
jgi:hypothetical protein